MPQLLLQVQLTMFPNQNWRWFKMKWKDQHNLGSIITKLFQKQSKERLEKYALLHGTKATVVQFNKVYPKYTIVRTTINTWKLKMTKENDGKTTLNRKSDQT